jgi:hypothetical protein
MFFYGIMASMDGHFRSPNRMEIVCNSLSFRGTSFQYSVIQLYLSLVEIRNPYLNLGWTFYIVRQSLDERSGKAEWVRAVFCKYKMDEGLLRLTFHLCYLP